MKMNLESWYMSLLKKICNHICKKKNDISEIAESYIKNLDLIFFNLNKELSESKDKNTIYRKIGDATIKIFDCDEVYIYVWDGDKNGLVLESFFIKNKEIVTMPYNFMPISFFPKIKDIVEGNKKILNGWDLLKDDEKYSSIFDFSSSLIGAFYEKDNFKGVMFIVWKERKVDFTEHEIKIFGSILSYLSNAITQSVLYEEIMSLAVIDTLTGLYNRRFFDDTFHREFVRANRYKRNLSLVMFDINDFKHINDNFGHLVGDMVLREVSRIIKENIRSIDIPVRYGGDEIILLLPETSKEDAELVVKKIREKLREWNATSPIDGFNGEITLSTGCSDIKEVKDPEEMVKLSDERMYEDKRKYKQMKKESREEDFSTLG